MKFKRTAASVLAALTAVSAVSVCAFAEENKVELTTLDLTDEMKYMEYLGDGYFLYGSNAAYIDGFVHLEKDDNGELTFTDVETDIDFSEKNIAWWNGNNDGNGEYFQLYKKDENGNVAKRYVMHIDAAANKVTTAYTMPADWSYTADDGYTVAIDGDSYVVYDPKGKVKSTQANKTNPGYYGVTASMYGNKYAGYYIEKSNEKVVEDSGDRFVYNDYTLYGIDKKGKLVELYTKNANGMVLHEGSNFVLLQGVEVIYPDDGGIIYHRYLTYINLETGEITEDPVEIFDDVESQAIYNDKVILSVDKKQYLYDIKTQEPVNDKKYKYIYTCDEGKTYRVQNTDDKWGYLDENGEEIGEWYDDADAFYGDYAPVVKDGKGYLIDRNFNRVSDMIDATGVYSFDDDLFQFRNGETDNVFATYNSTEPAPSDDTSEPADDTSEPSDDTSEPADDTSEPADVNNPETGVGGVSLTFGLAALAGAAVVVYRKKR